MSFYQSKLLAERDRVNAERVKLKGSYDSACSDLESARQRQDGAKDAEKAQKSFDKAMSAM